MLKRLLLSTLIAFILLISVATPAVHAQSLGPWYHQNFDQWFVKVFDTNNQTEIFGERYTYAQVEWIIYSLASYLILSGVMQPPETWNCVFTEDLIGSCLSSIQIQLTSDSSDPKQSNLSKIASYIFLQDRPISGITYIKEIGSKLSLVKEANAQSAGVGYNALSYIRGLWQKTRDITYILFVLIFIIVAFMIMFRVKLSPQTAVSIQSSLPKIVIALILVAFSYAIAGFLIDLMYVVIGLISLLFGFDFSILTQGFGATTGGVIADGILGMVLSYLVFMMLAIGGLFSKAGGIALIGVLVFLITLVAAIIITFKLIWTLFKSLAMVLLLTIVAPLQIALGVVMPGIGFGSWVRNYISNLAVFPVVGLLFLLAYSFLAIVAVNTEIISKLPEGPTFQSVITSASSIEGWPPLLNFGSEWNDLIFIGVSFVIFATTPKAAELIKSLMQGKPFGFGTAIGEATGPSAAIGKAGGLYGIGRAITAREDAVFGATGGQSAAAQVARRIFGIRK